MLVSQLAVLAEVSSVLLLVQLSNDPNKVVKDGPSTCTLASTGETGMNIQPGPVLTTAAIWRMTQGTESL